MHPHPSQPGRAVRGAVYVATGYAIRIRVDRGHLVVEDGVGRTRRIARFNRATSRLRRVVVIGSTGYTSLEALRWIHDAGVGFVHLDHAGRLITAGVAIGVDNPPLRRALARASTRPVGVEISRRLLIAKLHGQQSVVATLSADAASEIGRHLAALEGHDSLDQLRLIESHAAGAYWAAWRGICVCWPTRHVGHIPVHWTTFSQRASLLTGNPRVAVDPINAILNYLYAILEAEARLALLTLGLDAGLGILHVDQRSRDSLALDVMEPVRPAVDEYVLRLIAARPWRAADFHEDRTGQCRLMPTLARELATTGPIWSEHVAPHAEMIAGLIAADAELPQPATLLTGAARRDARPSGQKTRRRTVVQPAIRASACADCGGRILPGQKRCANCHAASNAGQLRELQLAETQRRRATGEHPSHNPGTRDRISQSQRARWSAKRTAEPGSGFTGRPSEFRRLILPRLAGLSPRELAAATGLSPGYCAAIRDGKRVPDVRHWAAFQLAGLNHRSSS
jgi:CRISPR-associated endonuclease Cas1